MFKKFAAEALGLSDIGVIVESKDFDKDAPHWLTYDLKGPIDDLSPMSLLGGGGEATELRALTERLRKAAADPKVRGLVLRFDKPELDMASAQDLHSALLNFRGASGVRRRQQLVGRHDLRHQAAGQRFEHHQPEAFLQRREQQRIGCAVERRHVETVFGISA